ncbi:hypothetical protein PP914_gp241 [Arthrobacter phage Qui]|jgi:hypothetical protein|uniref:Tail assembly chaperone n=1 Tax=Arthrobacter phage Qui TaxID=2603260 RepID=A0A5B8WI36_9CAUD|nr:hypothetical protein PP914_gp241 [Arthrobacter phage Qui]QED11729.1 hypothetical protein SEA_QUI_241 [Arthrobacter phage Qui]QOC56561.1 hypothetical protein SEA_PAELLA_242 [Arthrobacter phage Paella]
MSNEEVPYTKVTIIFEQGDKVRTITIPKAKDVDFSTVSTSDFDLFRTMAPSQDLQVDMALKAIFDEDYGQTLLIDDHVKRSFND